MVRPNTIVEIGVFRMAHLYMMAAAAQPGATLIAVDVSSANAAPRRAIAAKLRSEGFHVYFIRANSHSNHAVAEVKCALRGAPIDALYIDADHAYESARDDHAAYSPLVRPGGLIAFHDIAQKHDQVRRYWCELKACDPASQWSSEIVTPGHASPTGVGLIIKDD